MRERGWISIHSRFHPLMNFSAFSLSGILFWLFPYIWTTYCRIVGQAKRNGKVLQILIFSSPLRRSAVCESRRENIFVGFALASISLFPLWQNLCETRAHSGKLTFENLSKSVDKFSVCISMDALTLYDSSIAVDISLKILSAHHDDAEKRGKVCWIFSLLISGIASICRCLSGKQKREKKARRENLRVSGWRSSEMSRRQISV